MIRLFRSLPHWLFAPHARVTDPEKIQRIRLLSTILFALVLLGTIILLIVINHDPDDIHAPEVQGAFVLLGISLVMYILNRLGYNRYAAAGVIFPFVFVFTYIAFSSPGKSVFLVFLLIPILLTAIFFPLNRTMIISTAILALVFVLLSFQDQVSGASPFWNLRNMWFFLILKAQ